MVRHSFAAFACLVFVFLNSNQLRADDDFKENYRNPGGMWMPSQVPLHEDTLRGLGLEIDPALLSDPTSGLLAAIVSLQYCSGSFVSATGLILTNHHCVKGMLSYLSKEDRAQGIESDFVRDGFFSKPGEGRNAGPTERIMVTTELVDVSDIVLKDLDQIADPAQRTREIEKRTKQLVKDAEQEEHIRATVKSYYRGHTYVLVKQMEIKDVRLVHAPPDSIGYFGGDSDNWMWPRHTGDYGVIQAYVGPDGKPAKYSPDNIPYRPQQHLTVSKGGVQNHDLVFVAGYPGRTNRLDTGTEVQFELEEFIPHQLAIWEALRDELKAIGELDPTLKIKVEKALFSVENRIKNRKGALAALRELGYVGLREEEDQALKDWVAADPDRQARYGDFLAEMEAISERYKSTWRASHMRASLLQHSDLLASAIHIVRMAEERQKADEDREEDYQQREWERLQQKERSKQKGYDPRIDQRLMAMTVLEAYKLSEDERPEFLQDLFGNRTAVPDEDEVLAKMAELYQFEEDFEDPELRIRLMMNAKPEELAVSSNPLIQLALKLVPRIKEREERLRARKGELALVVPRYIDALLEYRQTQGREVAPDAKATLRLTWGLVRGYERPSDGSWQAPFTHTGQIPERVDFGDPEFKAPPELLEAIAQRRYGSYGDPNYGDVPVNLQANVDTTGGNSGSAALDARGQLIGLLFDGNLDSLHRDWMFTHEGAGSILLDIRYALWLMDHVYPKMRWVLKEMGLTPDGECEDALAGS